ncbi:MAG: hypothetical protein P8P83_04830, partial [Rickettsiaceae bacterium]|nr:hypothetical protein [Rickettsiaceae bacterium]
NVIFFPLLFIMMLLNQIELLQSFINESKNTLKKILISNQMNAFKKPCLNQSQIKTCFKQDDKHFNNIIINYKGKNITLTPLDIECLHYLQFGSSITHIAQSVNRSPAAIKDRIRSLKNKVNVQTKEELTLIARQELEIIIKKYQNK